MNIILGNSSPSYYSRNQLHLSQSIHFPPLSPRRGRGGAGADPR